MVIIHTNQALENQSVCADALKAGFDRLGVTCEVTADKTKKGDIQLIQGPWYCYKEWIGKPNVLWLNRCYYGCHKTVLSIGWLNADGSRDFKNKDMPEGKGKLPELKAKKTGRHSAVVFGDYGRDPLPDYNYARRKYDAVYFRPHPQDAKSLGLTLRCDLHTIFDMADVAVGHSSTVLVDAEINGLHVDSTDPLHVVHHTDREQWLKDLSWTQWSLEEIRRGDFWSHLNG